MEKFLKCDNCKKLFTQTIYKKKKSLPVCPYCNTKKQIPIVSQSVKQISNNL